MNSYTNFAKFYDSLMKEDIDYENWADYIEEIFKRYHKNPKIVCDLACGTGNFTIPMAKRGYDMIGVDKSFDMLSVARNKACDFGLDIVFLQQSFLALDLYGGCDAFLCMIDGFNYVLSPKSLYKIAKKIKDCFLEPNGIVVFDISSRYKLKNYLGNNTFIYDKNDMFYAWENKFHEKTSVSDMYITFFAKSKNGYNRFCEHHLQKAYTESEIRKIFSMAGYKTVNAFSPLTFNAPKNDDLRTVFVAF